jgi:hypothetical protein
LQSCRIPQVNGEPVQRNATIKDVAKLAGGDTLTEGLLLCKSVSDGRAAAARREAELQQEAEATVKR